MPKKKKTGNKKTNNKKHLDKTKKNIVYETIPNYSSSQIAGHQNNNNVQFGPQPQQLSRTDNLVGDLIGKLITKIETDGNQQTQQYSREIQPINNNNNINIQNSAPATTTVTTDSSGSSGSSGSSSGSSDTAASKITNTVTEKVVESSAGLIAGSVVAGVGGLGGLGGLIYNRKKIGEGIKNLFSRNGNKLGGKAQTSRLKEDLQPIMETTAAQPKTKPPKLPKGYHEQVPTNPEMTPAEPVTLFSRRIEEAGGTGMRTPIRSLSRSSSSSSNYKSGAINLADEFGSSTPSQNIITRSEPKSTVIKRTDLIKQQLESVFGQSSARKSLNSEERKFVENTLKRQNLDPSNLSPVNPDIINRARTSAVQRHDGVLTRNRRAQLMEPHTQLENRRGRKKSQLEIQTQFSTRNTNPFSASEGSSSERPIVRQVRSTMLSQADTPVPIRTRKSVTRNIGAGKKK